MAACDVDLAMVAHRVDSGFYFIFFFGSLTILSFLANFLPVCFWGTFLFFWQSLAQVHDPCSQEWNLA